MERGKSAVERHSKCMSSPLIPLTEIVSLHDRPDMRFAFNMSLSPSGFAAKHVPCLSAWTIKKIIEEGMTKKKRQECLSGL